MLSYLAEGDANTSISSREKRRGQLMNILLVCIFPPNTRHSNSVRVCVCHVCHSLQNTI